MIFDSGLFRVKGLRIWGLGFRDLGAYGFRLGVV